MTATEPQATPDPVPGPQPPDLADLWRAQLAPFQAGLSDADFERLVTERQQTEAAWLDAYDRDLGRELEADDLGHFEPTPYDLGWTDDPEATWEPDPDPEVGGWPAWSDPARLAPARGPEPEPEAIPAPEPEIGPELEL